MTTQRTAPHTAQDFEQRLLQACLDAACIEWTEATGEHEAHFAIAALTAIAGIVGPADPEAFGRFLICLAFEARHQAQPVDPAERDKCRREMAASRSQLLAALRRRQA